MATNVKNPILKLDPRILVDRPAGVTVIPDSTPLTRLNYFDGKFLRADDLRVEQLYLRRLVELSNQAGPLGVAYGYDVSLASGGDTLQVSAGLAIAPDGSVLFLPAATSAGVQDLIDKSAQFLRPPARVAAAGAFADCTIVIARPPDGAAISGTLYLITISAAEALCGAEDVFGKLCEEACVTSTDRPYIVEGIAIHAVPLRLRTPLITAPGITQKHLRSRVASAYFADERLVIASLISGAGLHSDAWCFGADGPSGRGVPLAVIARSGNKTVFLDAWTARREAIEPNARRYWAWRMAMRPWDVFLAQMLQFQCQLHDLFSTTPDAGAGDLCADHNTIIRDASTTVGQLADFYEAVTTRFRLQPVLTEGSAARMQPPEVPGGLANITGLFKRLATARDAILIPSDRILIDGGILELPSGGYLPVNPASALTVNQQVRRFMGKGVDLRFCVVRPDFVPHALEEAQHMDRISLVQGLDNPKDMPKVDILVPYGQIVGQTAPPGTAFQATLQFGGDRIRSSEVGKTSILSGASRIDVPQSGPVQFFLSVDSENPAPLLLLRPILARLSTALFSRSVLASSLGTPEAVAAPAAAVAAATRAVWIGVTCGQNVFAPEATGEADFGLRFISADDATPPIFESFRLNGVLRFSRAVASGAATRVTGTLSGTFSKTRTGELAAGGEIPDTQIGFALTTATSGQPDTLRIVIELSKPISIKAQWSGKPLVVDITATEVLGEQSVQVAEAILHENADVLVPGNAFHGIALHAINIAAAAIDDSSFSAVAGKQLFPPQPPATNDLIVKATLDWVLFHRRREKQCGVVREAPAPVPARKYRVYHHQVPLGGRVDSVQLIRQALLSNNSEFLVKNKIQFTEVDVAEFGAGIAALDTPVTSILADWQRVKPAACLVYGAIASQGAAVDDGDQLSLDRLDTLERAVASAPGASLDIVAGPDVLNKIVSPPLDSTNADGVIVLLTQVALPSLTLGATADAANMMIAVGNPSGPVADYIMTGVMTAPGASAQTIRANFTFNTDLPLADSHGQPPILTVENTTSTQVGAKIISATTFTFSDVPIELPGDPPAQRKLVVSKVAVNAADAIPGKVFLTGSVTSDSPVTLNNPKQLVAEVFLEGGHIARLLIWRGGDAGNRDLVQPTPTLIVTFDADNELTSALPPEIGSFTIHGVEYDAPKTGAPVTKRLNSILEALKTSGRLATTGTKKTRVLLAAEKHFLDDSGVQVKELIFLAINPGLVG